MDLTCNLTAQANITGPQWVSEPNFRGTFGILSLCASTLTICVWNAIHLDVPMYRERKIRSFLRNLVWKLGALVFPELFLWTALTQRANAKGLCREAKKYLPVRTKPRTQESTPRPLLQRVMGLRTDEKCRDSENVDIDSPGTQPGRRHEFTLTHGFYAAMGGYAFDFGEDEGEDLGFLPDGRTRLTVTAAGMYFLMQHAPDLIPDLPKTHITDCSDGSSLGKAILILQVSWFCANCIARLAQHLPLSLLEVTTVAHGVCTLLTYAAWWAKPLNLPKPTLIRGPEARKACAVMKMCSVDRYDVLMGFLSFTTSPESFYIAERSSSAECVSSPAQGGALSLGPRQQYLENTNFMPEARIVDDLEIMLVIIYRSKQRPWYSIKRLDEYDNITLQSEDIRRWGLVYEALRSYKLTLDQLQKEISDNKPLAYVTDNSTLRVNAEFGGYGFEPWQDKLIFPLLPALYGSVHFLGWNTHFPTVVERKLWRIATTATTCWGVGFHIYLAVLYCIVKIVTCSSRSDAGEVMLVCLATLGLAYASAVGYLLLESVRQLLYLEPAAFRLPVWSNYWPHFG